MLPIMINSKRQLTQMDSIFKTGSMVEIIHELIPSIRDQTSLLSTIQEGKTTLEWSSSVKSKFLSPLIIYKLMAPQMRTVVKPIRLIMVL